MKKTLFLIALLITVFTSLAQTEETFTFEENNNAFASYFENEREISFQNHFEIHGSILDQIGVSSYHAVGNDGMSPISSKIGGFYMYYTNFYLKRFYIKVTNQDRTSIDNTKDIYLNGYHFSNIVFKYKIPKSAYNTDLNVNNGYTLIDLSTIAGLNLDNTILDEIIFEDQTKTAYIYIDDVVYTAQSYNDEVFPLMQMPEVSNVQTNSVDVSSEFIVAKPFNERGFVYSTTDETPTQDEGGTIIPVTEGNIFEAFTATLVNMDVDATYYVSAYVKTDDGTRYSFPISTMSGASSVMRLSSNGEDIFNNSTTTSTTNNTDMGSALVGGSISHSYTISNIGNETYDITSRPLMNREILDDVFDITEPIIFNSINASESEDFTISASSSSIGIFTNNIKAINGTNTDYTFPIKATFYDKPTFSGYTFYSYVEDSVEITVTVKPNFSPTSIQLNYGVTMSTQQNKQLSGTLFSESNSNTFVMRFPILSWGTNHYYKLTATNDGGETVSSLYFLSTPTLDPVITTNQTITLDEGATKVISNTELLLIDPNGQEVKFTLLSEPNHGDISRNGESLAINEYFTQSEINLGVVSYVHDGTHTSEDSIIVEISNNSVTLDPTTILFAINTVNDLPIGIPQSRIGEEGLPITFTTNHFTDNTFDEEQDALLKIKITTLPTSGSFQLGDDDITLNQEIPIAETANITYLNSIEGTNSFQWTAFTNAYAAQSTPVTMTISADATPPIITAWNLNITEDETTAIPSNIWTENYSDAIPLTKIAIITIEDGITIQLSGQDLTAPVEVLASDLENLQVIPDPNFNGVVTNRWDASDGNLYTDGDQQWTITIAPVDDLPTAGTINLYGTEDTEIAIESITLGSIYDDVDSDGLTHVLFDLTNSSGTLTLNGIDVATTPISVTDLDQLIYTPAPNMYGTEIDSIHYKVMNINGESFDNYPIYITLSEVDDPPTNQPFNISLREDDVFSFTFSQFNQNYNDIEQAIQSKIKITQLPSNGKLLLNQVPVILNQEIDREKISQLFYTPMPNQSGSNFDLFSFQSNDGVNYSPSYDVSIDVTSVLDGVELGFIHALRFTGSGHVEVPYFQNIPTNCTLEFMVKPIGENSEQVIISSLDDHTGLEFGINASNQWVIKTGNGTTTTTQTLTPITTLNQWVKIMIVTGTNAQIAIIEDMENIHTESIGSIIKSSSPTMIIGRNNTANNYFQGAIDEMVIWNDIRTVDQAKDIYAEIKYTTPNILGYWNFNAIESTIVKDQIGTHNGYIQGNLYFESTGEVVFNQGQEETLKTVSIKVTDWDNLATPIEVVSTQGGTTTTGASYQLNFTPTTNFTGVAEITYQLTGSSNQKATHYIHVNNVDDAPVAIPQSIHVENDGMANITVDRFTDNYSDADSDNLEKIIITSIPDPTHGTLTHNSVAVTANQQITIDDLTTHGLLFTKVDGFEGTAIFNWNAEANGNISQTPAYVNLKVNPQISTLVIINNTLEIREDEPSPLTQNVFTSAIANGENITHIALLSSPENGYFTKDGSVLNTPVELDYTTLDTQNISIHFNNNWNGNDSFHWDVKDHAGYTDGSASTIVTVIPINDAPIITDFILETTEDETLILHTHIFKIEYVDIENDDAKFVNIETLPLRGELYYHNVAIKDNDLPLRIEVLQTEELVYQPNQNITINDTIKFTVEDTHLSQSNLANLVIDIKAVNDPPLGNDLSITFDEDQIYTFDPMSFQTIYSDVEGDALKSISIVTLPLLGTLTYDDQTVTSMILPFEIMSSDITKLRFIPTPNGFGTPYASFQYKMTDVNEGINGAYTIVVSVNEIQDLPSVDSNIQITLNEDQSYIFNSSLFEQVFTDNDNQLLQKVKIKTLPTQGTLVYDGTVITSETIINITDINRLSFHPADNDNGQGKTLFTFSLINDQGLESDNTGQCLADIYAVNDAPVVNDGGAWSATEGSAFTHTIDVEDYDQDPLTYTLVSGPAGMTVNSQGVVSWDVNMESNEVTGIKITISDGRESVTLNASIQIQNVNNKKPVINTTSFTLPIKGLGTSYTISFTATDADYGSTTFSDWTITGLEDKDSDGTLPFNINPSTGVLSINDYDELFKYGNFQYAFFATVSDGLNTSESTAITIDIQDNRDEQNVSGLINNTPFTTDKINQPQLTTEGKYLIYSSETPDVASIINSYQVKIHKAGSTNITVTQAGDNSYKPYNETFEFVVSKAPLTITAKDVSRVYGVENPEFTYELTGVKSGDTEVFMSEPTFTTTATSESNAGIYNIDVMNATTPNYNPTYVSGTLTINKAPWNDSWANKKNELTIGEQIEVLLTKNTNFSMESSLPGIIEVSTHQLIAKANGTSVISIHIPSDLNHTAQTIMEAVTVRTPVNNGPTVSTSSETMNLKNLTSTQTITLSAVDPDTDPSNLQGWVLRYLNDKDGDGTLAFAINSNTGKLSISDYDELFEFESHDYNMQVRVSDGDSYSDWKDLVIHIKDNRDTQTVTGTYIKGATYATATIQEVTKTDQDVALAYESSNPSVSIVNGDKLNVIGVGSSTITVYNDGDNQYKPYNHTFTLTVTKAPIAVKAEDKRRVYGQENPTFTYTVTGQRTGDNNIFTFVPTVSSIANETSDVGAYAIEITGIENENYSAVYTDGRLSIEKAVSDITWSNQTDELSVGDFIDIAISEIRTFTVRSSNEEVLSVDNSRITAIKAGNAIITVSVIEDQNHMNKTILQNIVVVNNKPSVITSSKTINLKDLVESDIIQLEADSDIPIITWGMRYLSDKDNNGTPPFTINSTNGILSISDYNELFKFGTHTYILQARVYDGNMYSEWKDIAINIDDNRDTQTVTGTYIKGATYATATIQEVTKTDQDVALAYESSNPSVSIVNGDKLNVIGVGSSTITVYNDGDNQYKPYNHTFTLTVTKAPITVTAEDKSRLYGQENPEFTYSVSGQRTGDNNIFSTAPTMSSIANETSDVGDYDIVITGGVSEHYSPTYASGLLSITKAVRDVSWTNAPSTMNVGDIVTVILSEDIVFTLSSDNSSILKVVGKTVEALLPGSAEITVLIPEDVNHTQQAIKRTIVVDGSKPIVLKREQDIYLKGLVASFTFQMTATVPNVDNAIVDAWELRNVVDYDQNGEKAFAIGNTGIVSITDIDELMKGDSRVYNTEVRAAYDGQYCEWTPLQIRIIENRDIQNVTEEYINSVTFTETEVVQASITNMGKTLSYRSSNEAVVTVSQNTLTIHQVGTSTIYVDQEGDNQVQPLHEQFIFTVEKAPIIVEASSYSRVYMEENPVWDYNVTGAREEDELVFEVEPMITSATTTESDCGAYPIEISGGICANYTPTYKNGVLTITKAQWGITWINEKLQFKVGETLDILLSSEENFRTSTSHPQILLADGKHLEAKAAGMSMLNIVIAEDTNHEAQYIQNEITVSESTGIWDTTDKITIYPNPASEFVYITGLEIKDKIVVIAPNGTKIKTIVVKEKRTTLPVHDLEDGLYLIQINDQHVYKVIVKK
ncbi:MBG domain-containing protein [Prolixibacteraceae bacterium]|nr:MBG domain-containing protein [Prolixibacteraceae bacterium]